MNVSTILLVLLGGACGTGCRYALSSLVYTLLKQPTFPYANLIINVSGSLLIGFLAELFETRVLVAPTVRIALLTGVLGGYTTFSSFSLETFALLRDGQFALALLNAAGSVLLGLLAVWLGIRVARPISRMRFKSWARSIRASNSAILCCASGFQRAAGVVI